MTASGPKRYLMGARAVRGAAGSVPVTSGTRNVVSNLLVEVQSQADALAAPSDTPTTDVLRVVKDATGRRVLWSYDATDGWKGVQQS